MLVGYTSLFYEAVGIRTSKDNFWTLHAGGGIAIDRMETIVAILSMGPVGPSDSIAWLGNRSAWLKATCNSQGVLLQPSTPIRTIDAKFALQRSDESEEDAHAVPMGSEVWAASSTVTGSINYTTHIVLAMSLPKAGFRLWRNDTEPQMEEGVDYVYRVHGSMLPSDLSESAARRQPCSNGSRIAELYPEPEISSASKCVVQSGRDIAGGDGAVSFPGHPQTIANSTHARCCAACDSNPSCTAWVFGPLNGVPTCFLARNVQVCSLLLLTSLHLFVSRVYCLTSPTPLPPAPRPCAFVYGCARVSAGH